jgi:hypothetical protein
VYIGFKTETGWVELGFGGLDPDPSSLALSYISHPFSADMSSVVPVDREKSAESGRVLSRTNQSTWWDETTREQATVDLDALLVRSMEHFTRTQFAPMGELQERIRFLFSTLAYMRGTRKRPSRSYEDKVGRWQAIGYEGEWTPTLLHERGGDPISFAQPPDVPSSVEHARKSLDQGWHTRDETKLVEGVGRWLIRLGLAESVESVRSLKNKRVIQVRVTLPGQQPYDITDVGFGISQILPVLVAGLMQVQGSLFVVDLPEAHLHPWPQARLADFFCSLALSGRHALVETHSEMFFHRLRLRAEMDEKLRDNIAVYFIDRPDKDGFCAKPNTVELTGNAQLRWPLGFFEEAWDIETSIRNARDARSTQQK